MFCAGCKSGDLDAARLPAILTTGFEAERSEVTSGATAATGSVSPDS